MAKLTGITAATFTLAFAATVLLGTCGSDSDDLKSLCNQACAKTKECAVGLAATLDCTQECNKPEYTSTGYCTNSDARNAKTKECLGKATCQEFLVCGQGLPDCVKPAGGAGGAPGAGGAGGTPGAGGAGGAAGTGCADCVKADACAAKLGVDAGAGVGFTTVCNLAMGAQRAQFVTTCQTLLANAGAACQ